MLLFFLRTTSGTVKAPEPEVSKAPVQRQIQSGTHFLSKQCGPPFHLGRSANLCKKQELREQKRTIMGDFHAENLLY